MPMHSAAPPWRNASLSRREALLKASASLAAIAVVATSFSPTAHAAEKKKGKASKEDFFYQESPGEKGRTCATCVNYEPQGNGDKGTCSLLEGEVCKNCFCQGWSDKKPVKKAA